MFGYGSTKKSKDVAGQRDSRNEELATEKTPLVGNGAAKNDLVSETKQESRDSKDQMSYDESSLSVWSKLTFHWFTPVLERGNEKKKLDQEDLDVLPLPNDCKTNTVTSTFEYYWEKELQNRASGSGASLVRALYKSFGADYIRAGILKLVHDLCVFVGPQVLHGMIVFLRDAHAPLWHGFGFTVAVTLSQLTMSLCLRHYFFKVRTSTLGDLASMESSHLAFSLPSALFFSTVLCDGFTCTICRRIGSLPEGVGSLFFRTPDEDAGRDHQFDLH